MTPSMRLVAAMAMTGVLAGVSFGLVAQPWRGAGQTTVRLCDKPTEDSSLGGCHLEYRDGGWYVTLPR